MAFSKILVLSLILFTSCKGYENRKKINQLNARKEAIDAKISDLRDLDLEKHQVLDSLTTNFSDQQRAGVAVEENFDLYAENNKMAVAYINAFDNPIDILREYSERDDNQIGFLMITHLVLLNYGTNHKAKIDSVKEVLYVFDSNKRKITLAKNNIQRSIERVQNNRNEINGEIAVLEERKNELTIQIATLNTSDDKDDTEKKEWRSPPTVAAFIGLFISLFGNIAQHKRYRKEKKQADEESAREIETHKKRDKLYNHLWNELTQIEKLLQQKNLSPAVIAELQTKKETLLKQLSDFMSGY